MTWSHMLTLPFRFSRRFCGHVVYIAIIVLLRIFGNGNWRN